MPFPNSRHLALILCATSCTGAFAASSSSAARTAPPGPPPEAIAACSGKPAGTQVSFSGPRGESFSGRCQLLDGVLAARPEHGRPDSPPPRQAARD